MTIEQMFIKGFMGGTITRIPLPDYFKTCLSRKLRPYQEKCMLNFLTYMDDGNKFEGKLHQPHLLFNMATGSGKTLIMAAAMLYLYKKGYRNFLFFVPMTNIIEKTRDNFFNTTSAKYLFSQNVSMDGQRIEIREVNSFQGVSKDCMNICLKTTDKLHTELNTPRENGASYEDYAQEPVVLIADEAHHLNSNTKKGGQKFEGEIFGGEFKEFDDKESRDWETTAQRIFLQNEKNIMLEFTATHDENDENIRRKYENKVIFKYDLTRFCNDRYSKDVRTVKVDSDVVGRVLRAIVVSEYKRMLFTEVGKQVKPVVLFKSKQKKDNIIAYQSFLLALQSLSVQQLEEIKSTSSGIIKDAFDYFDKKSLFIPDLILLLQEQFGEEHLLVVDGSNRILSGNEMPTDMQQALNSLEDENNRIRGIFAVDMLNEGWDVLNLFDIVRLFKERDPNTKVKKAGKTTMREAQLIGRGARYFAFVDKSKPQLEADKRKYDDNVDNPLRNIETLHYYCPNEPRLISELRLAFKEVGLPQQEEYVERDLFLKDSFKQTDLYKTGVVFFNKKVLKCVVQDDGTIGQDVRGATFNVVVPTGATFTSRIIGKDETEETQDLKTVSIHLIELGEHVIRMAMNWFSPFYFCNLKKVFPSLLSITAFITDGHYLRDIAVNVQGRYDNIEDYSQENKLYIAKKVLQQIEPKVLKRKEEYIGSHDFICKDVKKALVTSRKMTFVKHAAGSSDERGVPMLESENPIFRINLNEKDWYAHNDCFGTSEEKALVVYIDGITSKLQKRYEDFYLVRNEKEVKTYDFDKGQCFEPDYILFLRKRNAENRYDHLQIFLEPKGEGFRKEDAWKEDFLNQMRVEGNVRLCMESKEYRVWGAPFFTEQKNEDFREIFEGEVLTDDGQEEVTNSEHPFQVIDNISDSQKFTTQLPLYTLRAACGYFIDHEEPEVEGWVDVTSAIPHPNKDMFVVHAKGDSMLPKIKDGDLCVFELYHGGSRNGEIVLTQLNERDYDYGGSYTIKKYHSKKVEEDGRTKNTKVELQPLNTDGYSAIEIHEETSEDFTTIAILKCVL